MVQFKLRKLVPFFLKGLSGSSPLLQLSTWQPGSTILLLGWLNAICKWTVFPGLHGQFCVVGQKRSHLAVLPVSSTLKPRAPWSWPGHSWVAPTILQAERRVAFICHLWFSKQQNCRGQMQMQCVPRRELWAFLPFAQEQNSHVPFVLNGWGGYSFLSTWQYLEWTTIQK